MTEVKPLPNAENAYGKIGKTAIMVSYGRTFTDIPYTKEIFKALEQEAGIAPELLIPEIAPQIEARYKLISKLLKQSGINQIFELASGF